MSQNFTVPQVAHALGVTDETVYRWIKSGELKAVDLSTRRGRRPRYGIDKSVVDEFLANRRVAPSA
jgi:excisionase family DNA binding protein